MHRKIWRIEYNWRSVKFVSDENDYYDEVVDSYQIEKGNVLEINQIKTMFENFYAVEFYGGSSICIFNPNKVFCMEESGDTLFEGFGYYKMLEGVN